MARTERVFLKYLAGISAEYFALPRQLVPGMAGASPHTARPVRQDPSSVFEDVGTYKDDALIMIRGGDVVWIGL